MDEDDAFDAEFQDDGGLYDDEGSPEEEGFEEEDWDSFDEQDQGAEAAQDAPKKKSKLFNIILIGGSIVGALGIVLLQAGGGSGTRTEPLPPAAVSAEQAPMPAPEAKKDNEETEEDQGFLNNPKGLAELEEDMTKTLQNIDTQPPSPPPADMPVYANQPQEVTDNAAPPMPATMAMPNGAEKLESAPPEAAAIVPPETPTDMPRMPQASDLMKQAEPVMPETTAMTDPVAPEDDKMDQIMNRLDRMEADMNDLRSSPGVQGVSSAEQEKIAALEATVEGLKAELDSLRKTSAASATPKPQILGSVAGEETRGSRPSRAKPRPTPREEAVSWVLKGAQPGQAMVAREGSSEMQTVVIGDTLPGVGRITDVAYRDGRWIVEGTKGSIFQR